MSQLQPLLAANASLKGRELTHVYEMAKNRPDPETFCMFKKKEPLDSMAKSLLKFRIQSLTGKAATDIEEEMGYPSTRAGGGVPVEVLRRLAHFLILMASGQLEAEPAKPQASKVQDSPPKSRKRGAAENFPAQEPQDANNVTVEVASSAKKARASRKSMAPNISQFEPTPTKRGASRRSMFPNVPSTSMSVSETVGCRLTASKADSTASTEDDVEMEDRQDVKKEEIKVEDLGLGPNPTQMMIAQKRRSIAVGRTTTPVKKAPARSPAVPVAPTPPPKKSAPKQEPAAEPLLSPTSERRRQTRNLQVIEQKTPTVVPAKVVTSRSPAATKFGASKSPAAAKRSSAAAAGSVNLAPRQAGFPGADESMIYLAHGDPMKLTYETCVQLAPEFSGAHLTIVHTPVEWNPMDVFNLTRSIRKINERAELESFLVLVGCGLSNVHLIHDALHTQTKRVQFVVFSRADQNLKEHKDDGMMLRDVTSYFLLAYFYPGCDKEDAEPEGPMVRPGITNNFQTENAEDLENKIVFAFTEKEDWILDLCCNQREISLACQKSGRNALAIDLNSEKLFPVKEKAAAIAEHQGKGFRKNLDGMIQQF